MARQGITPFRLEPVLEEKKLLCLEAWSGYLFAGLSDGSLLLITNQAAAGEPPKWAVRDAVRSFAKRHVLQLVVAHSRSMLLSLTGEGVSAHVLPSLRLKAQALRTKGAHLFCWDDASGMLCAAVKRRLLVFKYDGLEIVEQREVSMPDSVHSMQLAGNSIYVGLQQEYVVVDITTGALVQLFASKAPHTSCTAVPPANAAALAATAAAAMTAGPGAAAPVLGLVAAAAGVLLTRDSQSVLMGSDGRLSRRGGGVSWSAPPRVVAVSGPYAVAGLEPPPTAMHAAAAAPAAAGGAGASALLEVRLLEPLSTSELVQSLELGVAGTGEGGPTAAVVDVVAPSPAPDGSVFVGCKASGIIARLQPAPCQQQATEMLQLEEYEEALYLCALMPPDQTDTRRNLEDQIHLRYGQQLFGRGRYDEAMAHFGQSSLAGPIQLLVLFPSLAPRSLLEAAAEAAAGSAGSRGSNGTGPACNPTPQPAVAEPHGAEFVRSVYTVLPYLLSYRGRLAAGAAPSGEAQPELPTPPTTAAAAPGAHMQSRNAGAAGEPGSSGAEAAAPEGEGVAVAGLTSWEGESGRGGAGGGPCTPLAILVDTAVLLALLALPDSGALLRYVERPNCVDVEEGEVALQEAGRYSELVALYQSKGRHGAALELLQALSQSPSQLPVPPRGAAAELRGLPGVWAAVRYLSSPDIRQDINLITTHAQWILAADPDAGLEMFAEMRPPLPPSAVLPILTSYAPKLAGVYLEGALASGAAERARYEHELAVLYLMRVVGAQPGPATGGPAGEGDGAALQQLPEYQKLKQLILSSQYVDCGALLRVLPSSRLLELRAVLLERLGRHLEALRIYVHELRALRLAEAYCDRAYRSRQAAKRDTLCMRRTPSGSRAAGAAGGPVGAAGAAAQLGQAAGAESGKGWREGKGDALRRGAAGEGGEQQGGWRVNGGARDLGAAPAGEQRPGGGVGGEDGDFDIYLLLIQVILEERVPGTGEYRLVQRAPEDERWCEVARLLSRQRDTISPLRALELLPGALPLPSALPFLEGAVWGVGERRRGGALARSLRQGQHLQLLWELVQAKQSSILLTPERACSLCYKRIGSSAFVAFPSGLLAHYACYRRSSTAASESSPVR